MLLFDVSASLSGPPLRDLIEAGHELVRALRPEDSAALMTFSEPNRLAVPLTRQRDALIGALNSLTASGATSLHDAVFLGLQLRPQDADARPALLVFSDGRDTASFLTGDQLLEAARRSGVVIHVVELSSNQVRPTPFVYDLASAGGGRRWSATSSRDLRALFGRVLNELRARYLLTYYPAGVAREGWHDVKVSLTRARGDVTARPGYFVPPQ
jgi:VWFA-related protein